jgi:hypothetical protein
MGPKKDAKKGGGGTFEVDATLYERAPTAYPEAGEDTPLLKPLLKSTLVNVEDVLPEFTIDGEDWSVAIEEPFAIEYPEHILVNEGKALRSYLSLDPDVPEDPKAKGKKDAKKTAASTELAEPAIDEETGKALPRMFLDNTDVLSNNIESNGFTIPWSFYRRLDVSQKERKTEFTRITNEIADKKAEADAAPEGAEEGQKDDLTKKVNALEESYANALKAADVSKEEAKGGVVDPLMVSAFQLIARFGPAIVASSNSEAPVTEENPILGMQYLWRNIYPKLPDSTRPCYNPAGKYGVRLYIGGKWRIVKVTDEVPLDADGDRTIACSSNPLELWPMILAKAVYSAYTKCGYSKSLGSVSTTNDAGAFTVFAVHVLTGWQPGSPFNLGNALSIDAPSVFALRKEIEFGGASYIAPSNIPESLQDLLESEGKHNHDSGTSVAGGSGSPQAVNGLRTKKQFKDEYTKKFAEREEVITKLQNREGLITRLDDCTKAAFTNAYCVSFSNTENDNVVAPVLAVSYDGEDENIKNILETKLLIGWEIVVTAPREEEVIDYSRLSAVDQYKAKLPKLPVPTEVNMQWITLGELQASNAFIISVDTCLRTPKTTVLSKHWKADEPMEDAGGKGKKDARKGKGDAPVSEIGGPKLCVEDGNMMPTLLKLSNTQFFRQQQSAKVPVAHENDANDNADSGITEAAEALAAQEDEMSRVSSYLMVATEEKLSLSILIHADMPVLPVASDDGSVTDASATPEDAGSVAISTSPTLPSNIVIVLEEVRNDDVDPLVMRVELSQSSMLPLTRTTFHIPSDRLSPSDKEPLLFWVRVFSKASFMMQFSSCVDLNVGLAEDVWRSCGDGFNALVKEGNALPTAHDTEQILFRYPLRLDNVEGGDTSVTEVGYMNIHVQDPSIDENLLCGAFADYSSPMEKNEDGSVHVDDAAFTPSCLYARTELNKLVLSKSHNTTVVCRAKYNADASNIDNGIVDNKTDSEKAVNMPVFPWKFIVLTRNSIKAPANLQTNNTPARYTGAFYPNNKLIVVRDVISVEKASFPFSMKIGAKKCADKSGDVPYEINSSSLSTLLKTTPTHLDAFIQQLRFVVTLSKRDGTVVTSMRGRGCIHLMNIVINGFLDEGEVPPVRSTEDAAPADGKGKKDDKKGKGVSAGGDAVDIVVELSLDPAAMEIPDEWKSQLPYYFKTGMGGLDETDPNAAQKLFDEEQAKNKAAFEDKSNMDLWPEHNVPSVIPKFLWEYDILSGTVTKVSHDLAYLERLARIKTIWNDMAPGREEHGNSAIDYFRRMNELNQKNNSPPFDEASEEEKLPAVYYDDTIVQSLESAIWQKYPGTKDRLDIIFPEGGNTYRENISASGTITFIPHEKISQGDKDSLLEQKRLEAQAIAGSKAFDEFQDKVRVNVGQRIAEVIENTYAAEADTDVASSEVANTEIESGKPETDPITAVIDTSDPTTINGWWKKREKYRNDTEALNSSLRFILDRAKDAVESCDPNADPKKKKK